MNESYVLVSEKTSQCVTEIGLVRKFLILNLTGLLQNRSKWMRDLFNILLIVSSMFQCLILNIRTNFNNLNNYF